MSSIGSSTYNFIATQTVGTATPSITFNNIPQNYTDLVLVIHMAVASNPGFCTVQVGNNGFVDIGANYSGVTMGGINTSAVTSYHNASGTYFNSNPNNQLNTGYNTPITFHFMNYASTNMYKTVLSRTSTIQNNSSEVNAQAQLWRSYNPITTMKIAVSSGVNINVGSTVTLYGIKAADIASIIPTKAIGGDLITSDGTYTYHVFKSTGNFIPAQALTADILVVAGGGGGGPTYVGGGGGAGGLRLLTSQSFSTSQTVTIGAGGTGGSSYGNQGTNGGTSSLGSISASGGGAGSTNDGTNPKAAASGGSGGGANYTTLTAGSGNAGSYSPVEGYAGGTAFNGGAYGSGGGGGAGGAGNAGTTSIGGAGGVGAGGTGYTNYAILNAMGAATSTGVLSSGNYYYAGGGGGASYGAGGGSTSSGGLGGGGTGSTGQGGNATSNTGGGGGGSERASGALAGGNGGSGLIVVRYLS